MAPASKSYSVRALMCAALSRGTSRIIRPLEADDTQAAREVLGEIGVKIRSAAGDWVVDGGDFAAPSQDLFCHESAATLRFMTALCCLVPGLCRLTSGESLRRRPVGALIEALKMWGADLTGEGQFPPVTVRGGRLPGGATSLPGDISSQFVSALLLVAPLALRQSSIHLTSGLESRAYVAMTEQCLNRFGIHINSNPDLVDFEISPQSYRAAEYRVEGDWSSASYLLALGAVAGEMQVTNLDPISLQPDKALLELLREMGAKVEIRNGGVTVKRKQLKGLSANLGECIDLLPTVAVLAGLAEGVSELRGLARARLKESDRVASIRAGLEKLGIQVKEESDKLIIQGGRVLPGEVDATNDHRIAMAFSLAGAACGGVRICGAECVAKTFPEFWDTLRGLGVKIDEQ